MSAPAMLRNVSRRKRRRLADSPQPAQSEGPGTIASFDSFVIGSLTALRVLSFGARRSRKGSGRERDKSSRKSMLTGCTAAFAEGDGVTVVTRAERFRVYRLLACQFEKQVTFSHWCSSHESE